MIGNHDCQGWTCWCFDNLPKQYPAYEGPLPIDGEAIERPEEYYLP